MLVDTVEDSVIPCTFSKSEVVIHSLYSNFFEILVGTHTLVVLLYIKEECSYC